MMQGKRFSNASMGNEHNLMNRGILVMLQRMHNISVVKCISSDSQFRGILLRQDVS